MKNKKMNLEEEIKHQKSEIKLLEKQINLYQKLIEERNMKIKYLNKILLNLKEN